MQKEKKKTQIHRIFINVFEWRQTVIIIVIIITIIDQEVAGSITAGYGNILSWRLIMKYFPLFQECQLSVSGERMYTSIG